MRKQIHFKLETTKLQRECESEGEVQMAEEEFLEKQAFLKKRKRVNKSRWGDEKTGEELLLRQMLSSN